MPNAPTLGEVRAAVAAHGVTDAAVRAANRLEEAQAKSLGLDEFTRGILLLCGQQLGTRGATAVELRAFALAERSPQTPAPIAVRSALLLRHVAATDVLGQILDPMTRGVPDRERLADYLELVATWFRL